MPKYELGPHTFPSKGAAKDEFRRILNGAALNTPLTGADAELVADLIRYSKHENLKGKIGTGVTSVIVRKSAFGTRAFWLWRTDGSCVDFSFHTALDGQPTTSQTLRAALRWEVDEQITQFRASHAAELTTGTMPCGICADPMRIPKQTHVDHVDPTFAEMAGKFIELVEGEGYALDVECWGAVQRRLTDRELAQVWQAYHQHAAQLRLTHKNCNLNRKRGDA